MNYAVDYAVVDETRVARWEDSEKPRKVTLKTLTEVRCFIDALTPDDSVFTALGGVGGVFAKLAHEKTGNVWRTPTFQIKDTREELGLAKADNCLTLAHMAANKRKLFYPMRPIDDAIVELQVLVRKRQMVQRTVRIPVVLRIQQIERDVWLLEDPDEDLAAYIKRRVDEHPLFQLAKSLEKELNQEITKAVTKLDLYHQVFAPVDGIGPITGARLMAGFKDIRLYPTSPKMLAYSGWHLRDGQKPYRRAGRRANWNHELQDTLSKWQISMLKCSDESAWKSLYLERKAKEYEKHPEPERVGMACFRCVKNFTDEEAKSHDNKCPRCGQQLKPRQIYTPMHLHRRALRWVVQRLVTKWIWPKWRRFDGLPTSW